MEKEELCKKETKIKSLCRAVTEVAMLLTIIQLIRLLRGFGSCSSPLPKVERVKRSGTHTKSSQLLFMQLNEVVFEHHVHGVILQKITLAE